ncbi:MAG TPA: alpha-amylase family glycosyl hydrolase, partial [Puia sp.]|nr:alpha-amylase family glycosyl hydrolase [Puia sp.]
MKKLYLTFGIWILLFFAHAQELTVVPNFAVDTSSISIVVDCSKGNQGLLNYADTGDVYVHVGVITNLSTSSSDWRYVPFTWGTTNAAAHTTPLGANKYAYTINNVRNFFAVPAGETILKIAVLFRNGSGSLVQRNSDGSDMYINIYNNGFAAKFIQPPYQPMYTPVPEPIIKSIGNMIPVTFISNQNASLHVYFNGNQIAAGTGIDSISSSITITATGNQQIIATANNGSVIVADTINFYVGGATTFSPLPSGVAEGVNYLPGDTSVILVFFAPQKNKIIVVGDFNNWTQSASYQMNETPDSNYFWIEISGLTPTTEYAYQYVIDDSLVLADYNSEKVLDKSVDASISPVTYPNLKSFPSGAAGTLAGIIQTSKPPYNWQSTNFSRPANNNLRIYELWLGEFLSAANWLTLTDTLSYLKSLGINAIEVMPLSNFEGISSWGYNPNFYFAPDKVYGTEMALKQFIDACHQNGMAVIMDMVLNHSFGSSPMVQMYWDAKDNVPAANSPWFSQYYTHDYDVGYQFNNSNQATQNFRERVIAYWLKNYHIDGYRFDLATGFTKVNSCTNNGTSCNDALWDAYDTTRINIWNSLYAAEQAASPGSYCILEMFSENPERAVYANNGMMVWNNMSYNYQQATMGYTTGWDLSGSTAAGAGVPQQGLLNYQESHDEERLMYKNEQYGNSSGSYTVKDTATGLVRNEMATAFWAMMPGPKMLFEFGELGFDYSINWCTNGTVDASGSCRLVQKPARWDYLQNPGRKHLHDVYASLLNLQNDYPQLATSTPVYSLNNAFKTLQVSDSAISVTVIGNFDVISSSAGVTFQNPGIWYNYLGSDSIVATGNIQNITLNPGDYKVYINKKIKDTTTGTVNDTSHINGIKIYPSPVTSSNSVIAYTLSSQDDVSLSL